MWMPFLIFLIWRTYSNDEDFHLHFNFHDLMISVIPCIKVSKCKGDIKDWRAKLICNPQHWFWGVDSWKRNKTQVHLILFSWESLSVCHQKVRPCEELCCNFLVHFLYFLHEIVLLKWLNHQFYRQILIKNLNLNIRNFDFFNQVWINFSIWLIVIAEGGRRLLIIVSAAWWRMEKM